MGIIHGVMRFLGWKPENEEGERPIYPYPVLERRQNLYPRNGGSSRYSERSHKMLNFHSLIHKAIKGLLKKLQLIFSLPRPRKTADPILPIRKPAPTISSDPALVQPLLISSSGINDSYPDSTPKIEPSTFALLPDSNTDEEELQSENVDIVPSQQWPEENNSANRKNWDSVIISLPEFTCSPSYPTASEEIMDSAVIIGETAPRNVYFLEHSVGMKMNSSDDGKGEEERPRTTAAPILPIQRPAPTTSNDPLLVQPLLISSPGINDSYPDSSSEIEPTTFDLLLDSNTDDEELQHDNVDVLSSQEWPEENYLANRNKWDSVIISIPKSTYSLSYTTVSEGIKDSAVHIGEIALKNIHFPEQSMGMKMNSSDDGKREEDQRPEEDVMIKCNVVVDQGRWIKHYSSHHRILLVGEGDFSFSACLAVAFGSASNMIATSLDSEAFLKENYKNTPSNIEELRSRGCKVMHGIDATKMANHALLGYLTFDRIIFNFPFAGFFKELPRKSQLRRHQSLVSLFLKNAREMISENGEIHISHKTNGFHKEWDLESIASSHWLRLIEAVHFNHLDYPGYRTKCGFGGDNNFNCNPSKTYKFGLERVCYY